MKKRILLSFMLICIGLCTFGIINASAEKYGKYLEYTVSTNDEVTITDCDSSAVTIEIPSIIDGKPVTGIGGSAFYNCTRLTKVTIPDGVTYIGDSAFNNCYSLTSIAIPNSVTYINDSAFSYCNSLISITIPEGVTYIGYNAFEDCSSLTSIAIPDSVTSIGDNAFGYCNSLTTIAHISLLSIAIAAVITKKDVSYRSVKTLKRLA